MEITRGCRHLIGILFFLQAISFAGTPQTAEQRKKLEGLKEGSERWPVKTTIISHTVKKVSIDRLMHLGNPIARKGDAEDDKRIEKSVDGLKEGDIVTTEGWITLLALEKDGEGRDGDFHIQVHADSAIKDGCFIVEVPNPGFISDPELQSKCGVTRDSAISKLLHGKNFNTSNGNSMVHYVHVAVTGQLFFDASHLKNNGKTGARGKQGNLKIKDSSTTCWEIHPVTAIRYLGKKVR